MNHPRDICQNRPHQALSARLQDSFNMKNMFVLLVVVVGAILIADAERFGSDVPIEIVPAVRF